MTTLNVNRHFASGVSIAYVRRIMTLMSLSWWLEKPEIIASITYWPTYIWCSRIVNFTDFTVNLSLWMVWFWLILWTIFHGCKCFHALENFSKLMSIRYYQYMGEQALLFLWKIFKVCECSRWPIYECTETFRPLKLSRFVRACNDQYECHTLEKFLRSVIVRNH